MHICTINMLFCVFLEDCINLQSNGVWRMVYHIMMYARGSWMRLVNGEGMNVVYTLGHKLTSTSNGFLGRLSGFTPSKANITTGVGRTKSFRSNKTSLWTKRCAGCATYRLGLLLYQIYRILKFTRKFMRPIPVGFGSNVSRNILAQTPQHFLHMHMYAKINDNLFHRSAHWHWNTSWKTYCQDKSVDGSLHCRPSYAHAA